MCKYDLCIFFPPIFSFFGAKNRIANFSRKDAAAPPVLLSLFREAKRFFVISLRRKCEGATGAKNINYAGDPHPFVDSILSVDWTNTPLDNLSLVLELFYRFKYIHLLSR